MSKSSLFNDAPYLLFQVDESQRDVSLDIPQRDIEILRDLGKDYSQIAEHPDQEKNRKLWRDVNSL